MATIGGNSAKVKMNETFGGVWTITGVGPDYSSPYDCTVAIAKKDADTLFNYLRRKVGITDITKHIPFQSEAANISFQHPDPQQIAIDHKEAYAPIKAAYKTEGKNR